MDVLSGVAQPELREIVLFARSQTKAVSVDDVATQFRIHRSVARGRLDRLAEAGLLAVSFERRTGRSGPGAGRPAKVYAVPPETSAIEFPERHYEQLLGHLVDAVPIPERNQTLMLAGAAFGRDLADASGLSRTRGIRSGAERACAALGKLGFQAAVTDASDDRVEITTPTCPLRPLVIANAEAALVDRGMWIGLVSSFLPRSRPCSIGCETRGCLDDHASCRVVLEFDPDL